VVAARRGDRAHRHLHQAEADRPRPNRAGHRPSILRACRAAARPWAGSADAAQPRLRRSRRTVRSEGAMGNRYTGAVMAAQVHVSVDGRELVLSNLQKVLYPDAAFTKADVIDYYRRIAPVLPPHLAGRPPTLVRAPDGPDGERFFEKRCPPHHPAWVATEAVVAGGGHAGGGHEGCVIDETAALVWLAN